MPKGQIRFEGGKSEAEVDGIEEKNESEPHRAKKKGAQRPRQNDGDDQKNGASNHERVLGRAREADRASGGFPPAEGLDEVGGKKNSRPDGGKSPPVTEPAHRKR